MGGINLKMAIAEELLAFHAENWPYSKSNPIIIKGTLKKRVNRLSKLISQEYKKKHSLTPFTDVKKKVQGK